MNPRKNKHLADNWYCKIIKTPPEAIISAQLLVKNSFVANLVAQSEQSERHLSVAMVTLFP